MASEWREACLGDLIDIQHGFAFSGGFFSDEPPGDILLTPGNFAIGGGFQASKVKYYTGPIPENFVLNEGDLLLTMTDLSKNMDTLGFPAVIPQSGSGRRLLHNQRLGKVVIRPDAPLEPRFLFYLLCSREYRDEVLASATGTTVRHTSPSRIRRFRFRLPPIREQRAIAHILGTLDDKIELNRRMNETLEAIARALFKSWFVDFDPVRRKVEGRVPALPPHLADLFADSVVDSRVGEIPAGWVVGNIGDLARRIVDRVEDSRGWRGEPLIDLRRMPQRSIALTDWGFGGELTTSVTRFQARDTLFGAIRPYFHKVGIAPMDGVTNISVFVLRATREADWPIVAILCSMDATVDYATRVAQGTKMPVVSWTEFETYAIPLPPVNTRAAFSRAASPLVDRIIRNIHDSRILSAARDTLLPKLVTGRLRLHDVEQLDEVDV